jgi:hypothetical protein
MFFSLSPLLVRGPGMPPIPVDLFFNMGAPPAQAG